MNTYNSDCVVFNGTNVLKMNFLQKWLYYEDIPEYDIKRRLLNGDAYIVTYFNHTGIRLTHDVIRNIKQSLYKPYISDTYIPTIFNIKENTTIELNDFYFPLGISKIVIIQNDNNKAIVKDRHGNIIFDGSNKEDGRYELECIVEENNTSTGYFMDCFCFTGENDKWLETSNVSHNNNTDLGNEFKLVGKTPVTLNNDADIITLISKEECNYTIQSSTLADFDTSTIIYNNVSKTNNKDYIEIVLTSDTLAWYQSYANITISNLIVEEHYTLYIDALGITDDTTNHITPGDRKSVV